MTSCPTDARTTENLAPRKPPKPAEPDDVEDEEALEELVDEFDEDEDLDDGDASEDDDDESFDWEANSDEPPVPPRDTEAGGRQERAGGRIGGDDDEPLEDDPIEDEQRPRRTRARTDPQNRARGPGGGLGRPSTGPRRRSQPEPEADAMSEPSTELAPDISSWPGTAEAAKIVGRHTSTLKAWRAQGRVSAIQDATGCWRYNPDDLAEAMSEPEATDPGQVLAHGMSAIVSQGANANERLLAMTEIATDGLKDATKVLSEELKRAYIKIADLERKLEEATDKLRGDRKEELQHDRYIRRLDQRHELALVGARESSERVNGLLTMIGPIAASIVHRLIGNLAGAAAVEAASVGGAAPSSPEGGGVGGSAPAPEPSPSSPSGPAAPTAEPSPTPVAPGAIALGGDQRLVTIEARIADAMARLCLHIRKLDQPQFAGLRAMLPEPVAAALDVIVKAENDQVVGRALAVVVQAAQGLSDLQFKALRPIAPADVAHVIGELREIFRANEVVITPDSPR